MARRAVDRANRPKRVPVPDQILPDTFVQHVKAVCGGQFALEARTETLDQHRDRLDEGNAPDHGRPSGGQPGDLVESLARQT